MDRVAARASAEVLLGAATVALGMLLPHSAAHAMTTDGVSMFSPGLGCPAETLVGTALLAHVRADAADPARRRQATERRQAVRPSAPRTAKKAPLPVEEPQAGVLRSFYTCNAPQPPASLGGTGWRLVGPLRHG